MRVSVDYDRCEGHGMCEQMAPKLFELDDEGMLIYHYEGQDLEGELARDAEQAVAACPVAALRIQR